MEEILLIWATPGGLSRLDHSLDNSFTHMPPIFEIIIQDGIVRQTYGILALFLVDVGSLSISAFYSEFLT